jgi:hypothetical protein
VAVDGHPADSRAFGDLADRRPGRPDTAGRDPAANRGRSDRPAPDEWFYVTEGALTFWVGGEVIEAPAGSFVYGPRDVPHTFVVSSPEARFLLVAEPAGFESFVRALSRPAPALTIPPPEAPPSDPAPLIAAAAEHDIEILGPPGIPD